MSIAGDWGTGTEEARSVAKHMMNWEGTTGPDLTIHLGDVYYVGGEREVERNCLNGGKEFCPQDSVEWPIGRLGSFALNGNHEMYANGQAYFEVLLPTLGMKNVGDKGQGSSFFCLENDYWRILAVDTGYNSTSLIFKPSCELPAPLVSWLSDIIPAKDNKATILLSHHQYFSAFEDNYPTPATQLSRFFNKWPVLWIWGHEHRLAAYDLYELEGVGLRAYGRCIGHGGMPVDTSPPSGAAKNRGPRAKLLFFDQRINPIYAGSDEEHPLGINGFAQLTFNGPRLTIEHRSLVCESAEFDVPSYPAATTLLTETFVCDGPRIQWGGFQSPLPQVEGLYRYPNSRGATT